MSRLRRRLLLVLQLGVTLAVPLLSNNVDSTGCAHLYWTELPKIASGPRQELSVAALNNEIYIMGGIPPDNGTGITPTMASVETFSLTTNRWRASAPLPIPLNHANAAVVNGKLALQWKGVASSRGSERLETLWVGSWASSEDLTRGTKISIIFVHLVRCFQRLNWKEQILHSLGPLAKASSEGEL